MSNQMQRVVRLLAGLPTERLDRLAQELPSLRMPNSLAELVKRFTEWTGLTSDDAWVCAAELSYAARFIRRGRNQPDSVALWWRNIAANEPSSNSSRDWDTFESQLRTILACEVLSLVEKARELRIEGVNSIVDARILTDLRPVFPDDPMRPAEAMLVMHTLKLVFRQGNSEQTLCLSLESGALDYFSDLLERAREKERTLLRQVDPLKITNFEAHSHG